MDKIEEVKAKFFKQLLEDSRESLVSTIDSVVELMALAFNYGFEMGYEKGYSDCEEPDVAEIHDMKQSENVE